MDGGKLLVGTVKNIVECETKAGLCASNAVSSGIDMKLNVSGNIGIADAMCRTVRQWEDDERLLVGTRKECDRKGGRAMRKCDSFDELLSPKLKQNLKFKSFGSGRKIGTLV